MSKSKNPLCGIYSIRNTVNNKVYVGSSKDITHRWGNHRSSLRKNSASPHLQSAWNKYGKDNFVFSILTLCKQDELLTQEWAWINVFDSKDPTKGYNIGDPLGEYVVKSHNRRATYIPHTRVLKQYKVININTSEINTYNIREIKGMLNTTNDTSIRSSAQYWYKRTDNTNKTYKGFIFIREEDYDILFDYINYVKPVKERIYKPRVLKIKVKKEPIPYKDRNIRRVPITAQEVSTGIEHFYISGTECSQSLKLVRSKIDHVLAKPFKQRSHKGYWFRRSEHVFI